MTASLPSVQVFEPGLCCGTGICGVDVDQDLVDFSADLDFVRTSGGAVSRFNLAQEPLAFAENDAARVFLAAVGSVGLPLTLVGGTTVLTGRYPSRSELAKWTGVTAAAAPVQPPAGQKLLPLSQAVAASGPDDDAASGCCGGTGCC